MVGSGSATAVIANTAAAGGESVNPQAVTQGRVNNRHGSHPVDGRRPLSNTHGAALIRKRIAAVGAPSPP
ncbi:hypothetical protein EMIHUDRAFT_260426 [Emiliania huxleyi CCMP1516]|uniref:Uncharacterized protein n=2 Tax=Emiliania huxleyi TaxID=2903 RepID=A0A0D3KU69_EMIH1|nr:hypothetical protein EMIHUDRAFT_260426 [Emiliania huxleyi CCMP1516]EOD39304.1 hypothetical protein EMIHUDRAFT_260426 [Emiliania huxleyi CCMP1516]|eukprot:XP_005791733.1 hypothetical protein EMIHUDRAFT_260426 [Emiliania huxleyi CCMP1516]